MNRKEVQKITKLTRKAMDYYVEKGFVKPKVEENGYRNYELEDVERLKEISIFRQLGCSVGEISEIFKNDKKIPAKMMRDKTIQFEIQKRKEALWNQVAEGKPLALLEEELQSIAREENVYSLLLQVFPGYFGQLLFLNYKPFLQEQIGDEKAFQAYVEFVDQLPEFKLSEEEKAYMDQVTASIHVETMDEIAHSKMEAVEHFEDWYKENEEILAQYKNFKESEEYKKTPLFSLQEKFKTYMENNHYYEIAIPLIRKFSPSYNAYYEKMLDANDRFIEKSKEKRSLNKKPDIINDKETIR